MPEMRRTGPKLNNAFSAAMSTKLTVPRCSERIICGEGNHLWPKNHVKIQGNYLHILVGNLNLKGTDAETQGLYRERRT
jgi:hypothetical protein